MSKVIDVATTKHVLYSSYYLFNLGDKEGCLDRVNELPENVKNEVCGDNAVHIFNL